MRLIDPNEIDKNIEIIEKLSDSDLENVFDDLNQKQPSLFAYLMSISELYDEDVREDFFFIGFTVIYTMDGINPDLNPISVEQIEKEESSNLFRFDVLEGIDEDGMYKVLSEIIEGYEQENILEFIYDEVLAEEEGGGFYFNQDDIGLMIAYLKTIADCLDA